MAACCSGEYHTITLSNDGTLHSFGFNYYGQLGLGNNNHVSLPTPIPNLPQISLISCGCYFAVCVDCEGFIWSFGVNNFGQLGTTNFNVPKNFATSLLFFLFLVVMSTIDHQIQCGNNKFGQVN